MAPDLSIYLCSFDHEFHGWLHFDGALEANEANLITSLFCCLPAEFADQPFLAVICILSPGYAFSQLNGS
uniref:Uncharacterized protein n=1 Tax=Oryza brachyantha TaxID=4533 RepID=J3M4D4_ORYBR